MKLFTGNITEYFAHAQTVCIRPLLRGRGLGTRLGITLIGAWLRKMSCGCRIRNHAELIGSVPGFQVQSTLPPQPISDILVC